MYQAMPMFPMWIGLLGSLPIIVAILFFLISQKKSFSAGDDPSSFVI
jgi:hypothetical protein